MNWLRSQTTESLEKLLKSLTGDLFHIIQKELMDRQKNENQVPNN